MNKSQRNNFDKTFNVLLAGMFFSIIVLALMSGNAVADEEKDVTEAVPDKFMLRLGGYIVDGSKTTFSVNSSDLGLGTTIDYHKDLGGH